MIPRFGDMIEPYEDEVESCSICDTDLEWTDCQYCGGEGEVDCYEDDSLCYAPADTECCFECNGVGGWLECPNLPHPEQVIHGR